MQFSKVFPAIALLVAAGSAMAQSGDLVAGAKLPSALYLVAADGSPYCDGFTGITKNVMTGPTGKSYIIYTGQYDGTACGYGTYFAEGAAVSKVGGLLGAGAAMTTDLSALVGSSYVFTAVLKTDKTWLLYDSSGYGFVNDGTWTTTPPAAKSQGGTALKSALMPNR